MTLFLGFVTGIAWIWGCVTGAGLLASILTGGDDAAEVGAWCLRQGVLPWGWLLARYFL